MKLVEIEQYKVFENGRGRAIRLPGTWAPDAATQGESLRIFVDSETGALVIQNPAKPIPAEIIVA